jgi:ABC-type nitrate/sulfonate/bicarbonate transport system substrate-binding protein
MAQLFRIAGVPEHFNLPWRQAIADDAFAGVPLDVRFIEEPGGTGAMTAALHRGDIDAALVLTEGAVLDILRGGRNRLVSIYVDSPLTWGIHVAASSNIRSADDIAGKRVAISRYGSGSHLIAVVDALQRGFDIDDMQFVVVDNLDGGRRSLAAGESDVFLWERHMTQPLVDSGEFRRIGEREVPWPAFVVSARDWLLESHATEVRGALDIVAGYAQRLKTGADSAHVVSDIYDIGLRDAERWLSKVEWSHSHGRPDEALQRVIAALDAQGAIETTAVDLDDLWFQLP